MWYRIVTDHIPQFMTIWIFSWHILRPFVPINDCLNVITSHGIVAGYNADMLLWLLPYSMFCVTNQNGRLVHWPQQWVFDAEVASSVPGFQFLIPVEFFGIKLDSLGCRGKWDFNPWYSANQSRKVTVFYDNSIDLNFKRASRILSSLCQKKTEGFLMPQGSNPVTY